MATIATHGKARENNSTVGKKPPGARRRCAAQRAFLRATLVAALFLHCAIASALEEILPSIPGLTLEWDRQSTHTNLSSYRIRYWTLGANSLLILDVPTNSTRAVLPNLFGGRTYFFTVSAVDVFGRESDPSNLVTTDTPGSNLSPTAQDASVRTFEDQSVAITLGGTDSDLLGGLLPGALTFEIGEGPRHGTLSGVAPQLIYTPYPDFHGTDTFSFRVSDGLLLSRPANVSITVDPLNDLPTFNPLGPVTLGQNSGPWTVTLTGIGPGAANENDLLTITAISSDPAIVPDPVVTYTGSESTAVLTLLPNPGVVGTATIIVTVNDHQPWNNRAAHSFDVTLSPASTNILYVEAEQGTRNSPMVSAQHSEAANGRYVFSQAANQGTLTLTVDIPQTDNYFVWGRVLSVNSGTDSFFVAVDGGPEEVYSTAQNHWSSEWQWTLVNEGVPDRPRVFALTEGRHIFVFRGREASTCLDALYITNDPNFVPPRDGRPPSVPAGKYAGLFHEAAEVRQESSGAFTLTTSGRGTVTGKIQLGAKKYSFSAPIMPDLKATHTLRHGTGSLTIELDFRSGGSDQVIGQVTDGIWVAPLRGDRSLFHAKSNPAPFTGSYTVIFPGQDDLVFGPEGDGYGTVRVDANGAVTLAGVLADGTPFSQKATISTAGCWPLYVPLYSGAGSVVSWLTLANQSTNDIKGLVSWIIPASRSKKYPAGFTNETQLTGARFVPRASGHAAVNLTAARLVFEGGDLQETFTRRVTIGSDNRVKGADGFYLSMKLNPVSGLFSGTVIEPSTGKPARFSGALLQEQNRGSGFLPGPTRNARVTLER